MRCRWQLPLAALALATAPVLAAGSSAMAAPAHGLVIARGAARGGHQRLRPLVNSLDWSGYAASGSAGAFTSVSADWTQPANTCDKNPAKDSASYSDFWVGLDGYNSSTTEQIGTEFDCSKGAAHDYGWYDMHPAGRVDFSNTVMPGDHLTGSVTYDGSGKFTLKLSDTTQHWSNVENKTLSSAERSSAEIIAGLPPTVPTTSALSNFGALKFTDTRVNTAPLGTTSPTPIKLVQGTWTKASVSPIAAGGLSFTDNWMHYH